jgi:phosphoglucomutase
MNSNAVIKNVLQWQNPLYFDPETIAEAAIAQEKILLKNDLAEVDKFAAELKFGTGGLRALMGIGPNRLNVYTVKKVAQALASSINHQKKVVIGFDTRNNSKNFAHTMAKVFAANKIECFVFPDYVTTPLLAFSIKKLNCEIGIMITASHNPKEYNGIKVYNCHGGQVVSPQDDHIIQAYNEITSWDRIYSIESEVKFTPQNITQDYISMVINTLEQSKTSNLKYVYTPLHGTGGAIIEEIYRKTNLGKLIKVENQWKADGNFTNCESLNPESKIAFDQAIKRLIDESADIALATDPDTDRVAVVVNHQNQIRYLNGNEVGAVLCHYLLSTEKTNLENKYIVKTQVTSNLISKIASSFQVPTYETITGFKWIGNLVNELRTTRPKMNFLFAAEESCGYLNHEQCLDKDGVHSFFKIIECASYYKDSNKTLVDVLNELNEKYGYHTELLLNFELKGITGTEKMSKFLNKVSKAEPLEIENEVFKEFIDYSKVRDHLRSQTFLYKFDNELNIYIRPSGTEPKIKVYLMTSGRESQQLRIEKIKRDVVQWYEKLIKE